MVVRRRRLCNDVGLFELCSCCNSNTATMKMNCQTELLMKTVRAQSETKTVEKCREMAKQIPDGATPQKQPTTLHTIDAKTAYFDKGLQTTRSCIEQKLNALFVP